MSETFDPAELSAVAAALQLFADRCEEILALLGEKRTLPPHEREKIARLYRDLKGDLDEARKYGTLSGKRGIRTRAEDCFYDPAVRRAHIDLRPATNSHPIKSRWFAAVLEAKWEFSYWKCNLETAQARNTGLDLVTPVAKD